MDVSTKKRLSPITILLFFLTGILLLVEFTYAPVRSGFSVSYRRMQALIEAQIPFEQTEWDRKDSLESDFDMPSIRQKMLKSLVEDVLPGKSRAEAKEILGPTATPEDMHRDKFWREKYPERPDSEFEGYFYEEYDFDLLCGIGLQQQSRGFDPMYEIDPDFETLFIRFDENGVFENWYIAGDRWWLKVVGPKGRATFKKTR